MVANHIVSFYPNQLKPSLINLNHPYGLMNN